MSNIVDCTIVLAKRLIDTVSESRLYSLGLGDVLRRVRIDGRRFSGHDPSTHILEISKLGLVSVGARLADVVRGRVSRRIA